MDRMLKQLKYGEKITRNHHHPPIVWFALIYTDEPGGLNANTLLILYMFPLMYASNFSTFIVNCSASGANPKTPIFGALPLTPTPNCMRPQVGECHLDPAEDLHCLPYCTICIKMETPVPTSFPKHCHRMGQYKQKGRDTESSFRHRFCLVVLSQVSGFLASWPENRFLYLLFS